jgi:hypothetical protein
MATLAEATAAKAVAQSILGDRVAIGMGGPTAAIPAHINGVPVRVEVVGELKKRKLGSD